MALKNSQYDTIMREYEQKQLHSQDVLNAHYQRVYDCIPEHLKTPLKSNFITLGNEDEKSIIVTSEENKINENYDKILQLEKNKIKFIYMKGYDFSVDEILKKVGELKIDSVLLEGGSYLISKAFAENRIDGGEIFIAPKILGGGLPFINGFDFKEIKDCFHLENVKFNIYDDNISVSFHK